MWGVCERCGQVYILPLDDEPLLAPVCDVCSNQNQNVWSEGDTKPQLVMPCPPSPSPSPPPNSAKERDKLAHWREQLAAFDQQHAADLPAPHQAILFLERGYYECKIRAYEMKLNAPPTRRKNAGDREMRRAQKFFALWAAQLGNNVSPESV